MTELPRELPLLKGCKFDTLVVSLCHDFAYVDPLDKRLAAHQGTRVAFAGDARIVFRLSGTGTENATLRLHLARFERDPSRHGMAVQDAFADLAAATQQIACIKKTAGHQTPSVIT